MKYLESNPQIASGHLVIKGSRIRISHVLRLIVEGVSVEEIHKKWYSWIPVSVLRGSVNEAIKQVENKVISTPHA